MNIRALFANAIDYVRVINDNLVSNALVKKGSFVLLPSMYQRAYILVHETGELPLTTRFVAPDASITSGRQTKVRIVTGQTR